MTFSVEKLNAERRFGVAVVGLVPRDLDDEATLAQLRALWLEHGLIVFRDVVTDSQFQLDLSRIFGTVVPHAVKESWIDGIPELTQLIYKSDEGTLYEIDGELVGGYIPWHSDLTYVEKITHGGLLKVVVPPYAGGDTGFIDQIEAYDRLPDDIKAKIEDLQLVYKLHLDVSRDPYACKKPTRLVSLSKPDASVSAREDRDFPPVTHPIVYRQPETGRKVLNISPVSAQFILGMNNEEGHELLRYLMDHVTNEDLAYYHTWSADEMLLWDNWRMIHTACGVPADAYRVVHRTSIEGDYGLGRKAPVDVVASRYA